MDESSSRGERIKARRLALGIKSVREFAEASGISRDALGPAENGRASSGTYERAEAWLDRMEAETGHDEPVESSTSREPIRLTFHDVFGIGEIIAEGPSDRPDELVATVSRLLEEIRGQQKS